MAVALRALTLLGTDGASCALFVQELIGDWLPPFVSANTLTLANRQRLLAGMAWARVSASSPGCSSCGARTPAGCAAWPTCSRPRSCWAAPRSASRPPGRPAQRRPRPRRVSAAGRAPVPAWRSWPPRSRAGRAPVAPTATRPGGTGRSPRACAALAAAAARRRGRHRVRHLHVRVHAAHARPLPDLQLRSRPVRQHLLEHAARLPAARCRRSG